MWFGIYQRLRFPFAKLFNLYMFSFAEHIEYQVHIPFGILIAALIIPPIAYGLSAMLVLRRALGQDIIPLLRGSRKGKVAQLMSRSSLPFPLLYSIRSLFGNVSRSLTMIIGIAVASMAIILGGVYQDAYDMIGFMCHYFFRCQTVNTASLTKTPLKCYNIIRSPLKTSG